MYSRFSALGQADFAFAAHVRRSSFVCFAVCLSVWPSLPPFHRGPPRLFEFIRTWLRTFTYNAVLALLPASFDSISL